MKSTYKIIDDRVFRKYYLCEWEAEQEKMIYKRNLSFLPQYIGSGKDKAVSYSDFSLIKGGHLWQVHNVDFAAVAHLYAQLHSLENQKGKVICQIDTNPKNVICETDRGRYFLIDFVDWRWEFPEFDIINFLLFWASAKPAEQFVSIVEQFLSAYQKKSLLSNERWNELLPKVICFFDHKREIYQKKEKFPNPDTEGNRKILYQKPGEW